MRNSRLVSKPLSKLILYPLLLLLACSCDSYEVPVDVKTIINSTKNKRQLTKVLDHYNTKKDSLKFDAACFLIRNMVGKGSNSGKKIDCIDGLFEIVAKREASGKQVSEKEIELLFDSLSVRCKGKIEFQADLDIISYKQLKANIDQAFDVWNTAPYSKHLSYSNFLNFILPYRSSIEKFENSKPDYAEDYLWVRDSLKGIDDPVKACILVNNKIKSSVRFILKLIAYPGNIAMTNLDECQIGVCHDMANKAILIMRSAGIAVAIDYTPQWGNIRSGHAWNIVFDKNGKAVRFMGTESNPEEASEYWDREKPAKIFRRTYQLIQENKIIDYPQNIPQSLQNNFNLDVTEQYASVTDITLKLDNIPPNTYYAYICIFNNTNWNPIYWGKIKKGSVTFPKMGRDVVYLPVYCNNQNFQVAGYPFLLTKQGDIQPYIISRESHPIMKLTAKYPIFPRIRGFMNRMINGRFQGANTPDFSDAVDLFVVKDPPLPIINHAVIDIHEKFKYVRYLGPENGYSDISELEFYGNDGETNQNHKLQGTIIGHGENFLLFNEVFDDNWVSFFNSVKPGQKEWVGMEFQEPQRISKINYLPRNGDNCIKIGDLYELFFWAIGWISMGQQTAKDNSLNYYDVPKNTLYWLRNLTRGVEERIFTFENSEQIWW